MLMRKLIIFLSTIILALCQLPRFVPSDGILRFLHRVDSDPGLFYAEQISQDKRYSANDLNDILRKTWLG